MCDYVCLLFSCCYVTLLLDQTHHIFKHVFRANTQQQEVFDRVAFPLVDDLVQGKNGQCLLSTLVHVSLPSTSSSSSSPSSSSSSSSTSASSPSSSSSSPGLLFAYGITNSGKTYTMTGEPDLPGILPRVMDVLFNSIAEVQAQKYVSESHIMTEKIHKCCTHLPSLKMYVLYNLHVQCTHIQ